MAEKIFLLEDDAYLRDGLLEMLQGRDYEVKSAESIKKAEIIIKEKRFSLLLHDALYAPGVRCSLVSYVSLVRLGFVFGFRPDGLDLFYNGNLFGQATLKGDFIVLDLDDNYNNISSVYVSFIVLLVVSKRYM